jgi:hypothetical protein
VQGIVFEVSAFLGAFEKLREPAIIFDMTLSVCPHGTTFHGIEHFFIEKVQVPLKCDKNNG